MRVAIIGMGVIGKAQAVMFGIDDEEDVVTYDPLIDTEYPAAEIADCDFAVICVGTPEWEDGHADLTQITEAARSLDAARKDMPVLVRSTVPPGTTDYLFNGLRCHAPEFMGENPAHPWQESWEVPYLILGGDGPSRAFFKERLLDVLMDETVIHECTAVEAEMTKYVANLYWATRVTFVNEIAAICEAFEMNYENVRKMWLADPRMTDAYTRRDGFPAGFGGRCWPKDLSALIKWASEAGYSADFLAAIQDANMRFRAVERTPRA